MKKVVKYKTKPMSTLNKIFNLEVLFSPFPFTTLDLMKKNIYNIDIKNIYLKENANKWLSY